MYRLGAARRLLLRMEAAHAVSWLWPRDPLLVSCAAEMPNKKTSCKRVTHLALMLPALRRRRRGVLLTTLLRWGEMTPR